VTALAVAPAVLYGHAAPRIAPPLPLHSDLAGFRATAAEIGIVLMPWQEVAGTYLEAQAADGRHLYQEFCEVVSRQNGKTEKIVPLIVKRLRAGRRIMHTAQNRDLPREVFARVADVFSQEAGMFRERNGRPIRPRFANGQEEIELANGGRYKIVAPTRGGARGGTNDDVFIDELREMDSFEFIGAAKPTMTASPDPQIVYFSNAGEEDSVVLNSVRDRASEDPRLAYLEWSAGPDRAFDDIEGWLEGNPAIGHIPTMLEYLSGEYVSNKLAGTLAIFDTEHLCRWANSTRPTLVTIAAWNALEQDDLPESDRPVMAISMDPAGQRASAAIAWRLADQSIAGRLIFNVTGNPIDTDRLGKDLRTEARRLGVTVTGFDPLTDAQLARHFLRKKPITGQAFANGTARFVELVTAGTLRWADSAPVGDDLAWTARKDHDESGSFQAVRADDDHPIPAALAMIRAVWLASEPKAPKTEHPRQSVGF
jgi:hypothetical protein